MPISRREFLMAMAATSAGLILPGCRSTSSTSTTTSVVEEANPFLPLGAPRRPNPPYLFGLHVDERNFARNLTQREADLDRAADVVLTFAKVNDPVNDNVGQLLEAGYEVALTFEYWGSDRNPADPAYSLKEIAAGRHDEAAARWFEYLGTLPRPIHFRPLHEGNGDWYPWGVVTPGNEVEDYIPAFQHVANHANSLAGDNLKTQFCVNRINGQARDFPLSALYPGDDVISEMVINGYSRPEFPESRAFGEIMTPFYREMKEMTPNKPLWVGETACTERHNDKPEWIIEMFAAIKSGLDIDCLTWFDETIDLPGEQVRDWSLDSSPEALAAFKAGLSAS